MSNNYIWFELTNSIQCLTFRAAYQISRQLFRHRFYVVNDVILGYTHLITFKKCNTSIIVYFTESHKEPITNTVVTYNDYIQKVVKRHETIR